MTTGYLRNMTSKVRYGHSSSSHESIFGCVYQPAIQLIIHLSGIPPSDLFLEATILTDIFSSHHPHRYLSQPPPTQSQYPEKFACASDWTFRKIITKKTSHTFFLFSFSKFLAVLTVQVCEKIAWTDAVYNRTDSKSRKPLLISFLTSDYILWKNELLEKLISSSINLCVQSLWSSAFRRAWYKWESTFRGFYFVTHLPFQCAAWQDRGSARQTSPGTKKKKKQ